MIRKILLLVPLLLAVAACSDDDGADTASASGSASGAASASGSASGSTPAEEGECEVVDGTDEDATSEVHLTLDEYSIAAEESSADAGVVRIEATNVGDIDHEVVILTGTPEDVTLTDEGEVDETNLVGEIEAFAKGTECQGSFDLAAGEYTLLCALIEESGDSHYEHGMVTGLTVK
jgi:hypothetical protein